MGAAIPSASIGIVPTVEGSVVVAAAQQIIPAAAVKLIIPSVTAQFVVSGPAAESEWYRNY